MEVETNIAIIKVEPGRDKAVVALLAEVNKLIACAESKVITDDLSVRSATEDLSRIAKLKKAIEDKRREYVNPINEHLKVVNEAFKTVTNPLEQADKIIRAKILAYRQEQERKAREVEEINRLRLEAAQKEMALKGELTESVNLVETPLAPPAHVRTEAGDLGTTKIKKWRLFDFSKVPDQYKQLNEVLIGKMVRAGIPGGIPGIEIYEEAILKISAK